MNRATNYLELHGREVPGHCTGHPLGGFLARNSGNSDDPPLRPKQSEVIQIQLFRPRGVAFLSLLDEPHLDLFLPVVCGLALSSFVPHLPSLSGRQRAFVYGIERRGDCCEFGSENSGLDGGGEREGDGCGVWAMTP